MWAGLCEKSTHPRRPVLPAVAGIGCRRSSAFCQLVSSFPMSVRSIHLSLQGPGTGGQDDHGDSSCVVCMDRPVAVRSRPCNHAVTCELCVIKGLIEQRKPLNCFACCYCCDKVTELVWLPVRGSRGEFRHIQMPTFASGSEAGAQAFRSIRSFVYAMLDHTEPEVVMAAREALLRAERLHEHTPSRRRTRAHRRHAYPGCIRCRRARDGSCAGGDHLDQ